MTTPQSQPLQAAFWMIGAIVSFSVMAVAGRSLASQLDTFEIMLYRSLIGLGVLLVVAGYFGTLRQITTRSMHVHILRNFAHFAGQNLWFFAITMIPLAQVFAIEFTSPIWAMFFAVAVLGERLTPVRLFSAAVGFAGILIITRPWGAAIGAGVVTAALAAIGFGITAVFTRLLTRRETVTCIIFWLTVIQLIFAVICAGYDGDIALPTASGWPLVTAIGLGGLVAHSCITKALSLAPAAVVMPVDFTRLPLIAIVGFVAYNERLEIAVLLGGALIFSANYLNIASEYRKSRV